MDKKLTHEIPKHTKEVERVAQDIIKWGIIAGIICTLVVVALP